MSEQEHPVDAAAATAYALGRWGYEQGTRECIAFYRGACWQVLSTPEVKGSSAPSAEPLHGFSRDDLECIAEGLEKGYEPTVNVGNTTGVGDELLESTTAAAARFIRSALSTPSLQLNAVEDALAAIGMSAGDRSYVLERLGTSLAAATQGAPTPAPDPSGWEVQSKEGGDPFITLFAHIADYHRKNGNEVYEVHRAAGIQPTPEQRKGGV